MRYLKTILVIFTLLLITAEVKAIAPFFDMGSIFGGGGGFSFGATNNQNEESGDKGMFKIIREHLEEDEYWKEKPTLETRDDKKQNYYKDVELSDDAKKTILYCFSMREEEEEDAGEEKFKGFKEEDMEQIWKGEKTVSGIDDGFRIGFNTRYSDRAIYCMEKKEKFFQMQLWMETMGGLLTQTGNDDDPEAKEDSKRRRDDEWVIEEEEREKKNFDIFRLWRAEEGKGVLQTLHHTDPEEEKKGEENAFVYDFSYFTYEDEGQGEMSHEEPEGLYRHGRPDPNDEGKPKSHVTQTVNFADYRELTGLIGEISDAGIFMQIINQSPGRARKVTNKKFEAQEVASGGTDGPNSTGEHYQKQRLWSRNPGRNPGYSIFYVEKDDNAEEGESPYKAFEYEGDFFEEFNARLEEYLNKTYCKDEIAKRLKDTGVAQDTHLQLIQRCQDLEDGIWERFFEIEKFATKTNDQFLEGKHLYLASTRETENNWTFSLWVNLVDEALDRMLGQSDNDPQPEEEEADEPAELECDKYDEFEKIIKRIDENQQELDQIFQQLKLKPPNREAQTDAFALIEEDQVKKYMDHLVEEFFPDSFKDLYDEYWEKTQKLDKTFFKIRHGKKPEKGKEVSKDKNTELRTKAGGIIGGHYNIWLDLLPFVIVDEYLVPRFNVKSVIEYGPYYQKFIEDNKTKTDETGGEGDPDKDTEYVRKLTLELDWHKMRACRDQDEWGDIPDKKEEHAELPNKDAPDFQINQMNGDIKEVSFKVCREKRVPPIAGVEVDRNDRCSLFRTEKQLEEKFKLRAKSRGAWSIWPFRLSELEKNQKATPTQTDAKEDEGQKIESDTRKHQYEMYMACMTDYNVLSAQLDHSLWKEWFGNENWDGKDPGIQYECLTENEAVGTKWTVVKLNEILKSMKRICEQEHNIKLPCPDRFQEIQ